jgi:hypothetical protein
MADTPARNKTSDDPVLVAKLANIYHWSNPDLHCNAGNCPGADECCYAEGISMEGLKAVADAVEIHVNHQVYAGLDTLRREVREAQRG